MDVGFCQVFCFFPMSIKVIIFFFFRYTKVNYTDWFLNAKPTLHSCHDELSFLYMIGFDLLKLS